MKKVVLGLILFLAVTVQAQEKSALQTKSEELIKLTGAGKAFEDAIMQIGAGVGADKKEAYKKEAEGTLVEIYDQLGALYAEEFTEEEIDSLISFYHTDLGKKLSVKQLLISQKAMMVGQTWGMKVSGIAQKYAQ
ncbi:uncharacterized protein DUF2059 [Maribacter vaceletii]|uniref:Uncharacterized protein DUF2059 n=1 Tax=Maribacter vaceletii TaxID=1206816 RepID=A0A495ECY1_9FLAO|nr:DUF2059 domain-containing protein [Maribacter vaceletii]RKR14750.1 uncharacterized protein DUF2059 [Maribacter vaceletii]